jgi:hypothetical protein
MSYQNQLLNLTKLPIPLSKGQPSAEAEIKPLIFDCVAVTHLMGQQ